MKIVLTGILENISTRSDGSVKLTIGTNEMDSSNAANLFELRNTFLKILLTNGNISPLEEQLLEETKLKDGKKVKTDSQRMRAVIYRVWEQSQSPLDFDTYYHEKMQGHIENYKAMLE